jgi:hypothetical protein
VVGVHDGFETALEKMPAPPMLVVEPHAVTDPKPLRRPALMDSIRLVRSVYVARADTSTAALPIQLGLRAGWRSQRPL